MNINDVKDLGLDIDIELFCRHFHFYYQHVRHKHLADLNDLNLATTNFTSSFLPSCCFPVSCLVYSSPFSFLSLLPFLCHCVIFVIFFLYFTFLFWTNVYRM